MVSRYKSAHQQVPPPGTPLLGWVSCTHWSYADDADMTIELIDLYGNNHLMGAGMDIGAVERQ